MHAADVVPIITLIIDSIESMYLPRPGDINGCKMETYLSLAIFYEELIAGSFSHGRFNPANDPGRITSSHMKGGNILRVRR